MLAGAALLALFGLWLMLRDRREPPAPRRKLESRHALFPSVLAENGCSGADTCDDCLWGIGLAAASVQAGMVYHLPYAPYDLFVWEDGSYSVLPAIAPDLN